MESNTNKFSLGKLLISFMAVSTAVSPYLADWNISHIYNPSWPPHAKFHNGQTMVLGALLGILSMWCLWVRKNVSQLERLNEAALLAVLYWVAQVPAILFPGTSLSDPNGYQGKMPIVLGIEINQVVLDFIIVFPIIILGYVLERRRLGKSL